MFYTFVPKSLVFIYFYLMYKSDFASLYSSVQKFAWSAQEGQRSAIDPLELELQVGFRVYKLQGFTDPRWAQALLGRPAWPQPPKHWDYRYIPPCPVYVVLGTEPSALCMLSNLSTEPHPQAQLVVLQILISWPSIHGHTCVHLCKHTHTHTQVNNFFSFKLVWSFSWVSHLNTKLYNWDSEVLTWG